MSDGRFLDVDAAKLRRLRRESALSQQELADMAGVTQETVSRLELGRNLGRGRTLRKLAGALGVKPVDLMRGSDDGEAENRLPRGGARRGGTREGHTDGIGEHRPE